MTKRGRTPKPAGRRSPRTRGPVLAVVLDAGATPAVVPAPPNRADGRPLCDAALLAWDDYWTSPLTGLLDGVDGVDRYTVDRWVRCLDQLERLEAAIGQIPLVRGSTGQPALNPLIAYQRQLRAELGHYQDALGLTPLARARLGLVTATERMTADRVAALLASPP